jgi:hypothetical protein
VQIYVDCRGSFDVCLRKIRVEEKRGKMVANKIKKNHIREVVCVCICICLHEICNIQATL